ncbi:MAG: DUF5687 family protein, partial [Bacteroidota bacterium]|nr:DUF5687 family protein [Bacteroidota bacterium]
YRRSAAFTSGLITSVFYLFGMLYFIGMFTLMGYGSFYLLDEEMGVDPLHFVNQYMIYGTSFWVVWRYFIQKMPVLNIQALLILPIKGNSIVHYALGRTVFSFFNVSNAFFFIPFSIALVDNGYPFSQVLSWHLAIVAIVFFTNYLNILINDRNDVFYGVALILVLFAVFQRYNIFDITTYTGPIFDSFYNDPIYALIPWLMLLLLYQSTFTHFKRRMYLDAGLQVVKKDAQEIRLGWLNRFGRTIFSFFNISNAFFFIPFSAVLVNNGYPLFQVMSWHLAIVAIVFYTNYLNILINDRNDVFYGVALILVLFAVFQRYEIFDITTYTGPVFDSFYYDPIYALIPWL